MLDNASLAARSDLIVELNFARKSDALSPWMMTSIEFDSTKSYWTDSQAKLAANATW